MIERETRGAVALLRLVHGKANALDLEFLAALEDAFESEQRSSARAIVLTGSGSIFSAGVDLVRMLEEGRPYLERFLPALDRALRSLFVLEKPVVAAINGHAIAGGAILAAASDRRLLARGKATFGAPELKVGVPFPPLPLEIFRRICPPSHVDEAVLGARVYRAEEALALGLVDELVEPELLLARGLQVAGELAALPARAFALNKRMLRQPSLERVARQDSELGGQVLEVWCSAETREALRGYVERTLEK